jgi:putative ABC transport system ATP-binding protein
VTTLVDATSGIAVLCRRLTKAYRTPSGSAPALRGIDLAVREREILFLAGPSGCGKTTLLSIIAGVLHQDSGDCLVFGSDLAVMPSAAAARFRRKALGFVFQSFNLIPSLSVIDNVTIPLLLRGNTGRVAVSTARTALASVGLAAHVDKMPAGLSGGQQQRVAIARAIVHSPRLVVCDEPTSALDHRTGQEVMSLLRGLARDRGTTLVVVTHDPRIYEHADRIAEMDDGQIVGVRGPAAAANP